MTGSPGMHEEKPVYPPSQPDRFWRYLAVLGIIGLTMLAVSVGFSNALKGSCGAGQVTAGISACQQFQPLITAFHYIGAGALGAALALILSRFLIRKIFHHG